MPNLVKNCGLIKKNMLFLEQSDTLSANET